MTSSQAATTAPRAALSSPSHSTSFIKSTIQLLLGGVGAQILIAATFGLVARELGRNVFGLVVVLFGVGAVAQDLLDFGTSQWFSRELAAGRQTVAAAVRFFRIRALLVALFGALVVTFAMLARVPVLIATAVLVYDIGAVSNAGMHARLRAAGAFRRSALHLVLERAGWLSLSVAVVLRGYKGNDAGATLVAAMGLCYLGSAFLGPRVPASASADAGLPWVDVYRRSTSFGLLGLSSDLQQLDATVAAPLGGVAVAADVGIASKLSGPLGLVAVAITHVAFRGVAADEGLAKRSAGLALRLSLGVAAMIAVAAPLLPLVVVSILGHQYDEARSAILIYALGTAVAVVNQPLSAILTARSHDRIVSWIIMVAVATGLAVGAAGVNAWGAVGMGIGFVVTQVLILSGCTVLYRRPGVI